MKTSSFDGLFAEPQKNGLTRPKAVRGAGVKMVNMGELFAYTRLRDTPMDRVPLSDREQSFLLEPGDLLFARQSLVRSGAGKCVLFVGDSEPVTFESHIIRTRLDSRRAHSPYYFYWFNSPLGRDAIDAIINQVAAAGIRGSDLARLPVPVPALDQQREIARILGALDDKIELNRRTNETLEAMARALFQSWFVDFDPMRAKMEGRQPEGMDAKTAAAFPDALEDSPLGEVPVGWPIRPIGDLLSLVRGTTYSGQLVGLPGPALLGLGSIIEGGGFREGRYKTYGGECPPKLMLFPGELFVALKGATKDGSMVGSIARVPPSVPSGRLTQDTVKLELVAQRAGLAQWLYRLLLTPDYRTYCANRVTGSAQAALSREDFLAYSAPLPPDPVLACFGQLESSLAARGHAADSESKTLTALRDTLLPRLLSGELRVPEAEKAVSAVL